MTCEVAVMNRWGVALAADSAVCLGNGEKIYNSAEKLFQLGTSAPVGIMTFGPSDFAGVPWEVIIADYSRRLDGRRFDTVGQHFDDFIHFVEGANWITNEDVQRDKLKYHASAVWRSLYAEPLRDLVNTTKGRKRQDPCAVLLDLIRNDHPLWQRHQPLAGIDAEWADGVIASNAELLDQVAVEVFAGIELSADVREGLRTTLRLFLTHACDTPETSNVVVAGLGEAEPFPELVYYQVGPVLGGRIRLAKMDEAKITAENDASVLPFAQRDAIAMVISGIHPEIREMLPAMAEDCAGRSHGKRRQAEAEGNSSSQRFGQQMDEKIEKGYVEPFMTAVAGLPRNDLATLAEALVSLAVFQARISVDTRETVKGPVDVALLSKGGGFVWVKRKGPVGTTRAATEL